MFICNLKLNGKNIVKFGLIVISIIVIILFCISLYKILSSNFTVQDEVPEPDVAIIDANSYTNILQSVYDNLDLYIGQKICFSGYVFRKEDFPENEFVLARDMKIEGSTKPLVVGFLCSCNNAKDFADNTWVEITGEITKGNYCGTIPMIKVTKIKEVSKPADEFVCPPDSTYIPTAIIY